MAYLIYYQNERMEFGEAFKKTFKCFKETEIVFKKLCKHFKLVGININYTSGRNHSKANSCRVKINLDDNNFGTLCHEVAHVYQLRKLSNSGYTNWHNKEHHKVMKRMINYCKKKNWFDDELNRRISPKPIKPQPSLQELKAKELIKLQERIVKYERKILFYQRKLSKAKRSYTMRNRNLIELKGNAGSPERASHPYSAEFDSRIVHIEKTVEAPVFSLNNEDKEVYKSY